MLLAGGELLGLTRQEDEGFPQAAQRVWNLKVWPLHDMGPAVGRPDMTPHLQALTAEAPAGLCWGEGHVPPIPGARIWQRPGWPRRAQEVLDRALTSAHLTRTADPEPVHSLDLVAVLRAETTGGTVYLKASDTPREAAVTALLARTQPELLPPLLWADAGAGLTVSASGGELLDGVTELGAWEEALTRLAQFQTEADASALAALGCPAWPLGEMREQVDAFLGDGDILRGWGLPEDRIEQLNEARPFVRAAFADLAAHGLPDLPAHGDAHPRNALFGPRGSVWFDWSEAASAAHPFIDMGWFLAFTLHPARAQLPVRVAHPDLEARLSAAYLRTLGCPEAGELLRRSLPLALLHRAVVYDHHFRHWEGTLPGWRPQYVPYYLRLAVRELKRLA